MRVRLIKACMPPLSLPLSVRVRVRVWLYVWVWVCIISPGEVCGKKRSKVRESIAQASEFNEFSSCRLFLSLFLLSFEKRLKFFFFFFSEPNWLCAPHSAKFPLTAFF